jgi:hypothetical protein
LTSSARIDLVFTGDGELKVDAFLGSIRMKALDAHRTRDTNWMADLLSACVEGPALAWYESLDGDTQRDWEKLKAALIARFPIA